jgi:hypothetical protein
VKLKFALLFFVLALSLLAVTALRIAGNQNMANSQIAAGTTTALAAISPTAIATPTGTPSPTTTPTPTTTPSPTDTPSPTPTATARPALFEPFRPYPGDQVDFLHSGVVHVKRVTDDPLRINVLVFDITDPRFDFAVGIGDGWLSGRTRTSYIAEQNEAIAAVNGDLFSGTGIPQGLTIIDGEVVTAPKYRATFAWSEDREPFIGYFTEEWTWKARVITPSGDDAPVTLLNSIPCPLDQICLFNEFARVVPGQVGDTRIVLSPTDRVTGIYRGERVRVDEGEQVLQGTGEWSSWLREHVSAGNRLRIEINTDPPLDNFDYAVSGGPIILRNGSFVQDCMCALRDCSLLATPVPTSTPLLCEDFTTEWKERHYDYVRMPRTGIGFDREHRKVIVAVVDGYQRGYSRGITQREFADLFLEFGADTAMELDGGGSTTMVLNDTIVNRPSDDTGERYVANALLFHWNDPRARRTPTPTPSR